MTEGIQKQLYGIGIFEDEIVLSDFTSAAEKRFIVTSEQLQGFFRSEITFTSFPGLIWMKLGGDRETYLVTLPAGERTILYRQVVKKAAKGKKATKDLFDYKMRLPAIAVKASVDPGNRKIGGIAMWGFFDRVLGPTTALYELPLPNLSGSILCLGSTERAAKNGDILAAIERTIFDTPFNHHNHLVGSAKIPFQEYVAKHRGRCPVKTLVKIGAGKDILGGAR